MSEIRHWVSRLGAFFGRRREGDLADELQFHLDMAEQQLRRGGMTAEDARREARVRMGGVTQIAESYRDQRGLPFAESLLQDVRYAARTLRRTPGFTMAALLTLALGIGANTAIFTIVNAVLLRPLPYAASDRLVIFGDRSPDGSVDNIGYGTFQDFRDRSRTFDSMAAFRSWYPTLVAVGEAERVPAMRVSWNYFDMLGVRPALGRAFAPGDDKPEHWRVLLLSDGLWKRRFGADPNVVGRTVTMNDRQFRIIGVMPAGFEPLISAHFYQPAEMWAALGYDTTLNYACRSCQHLKALGRVRAGVGREEARAELATIRQQLFRQYPGEYAESDMAAVPLQDEIAGPVRPALYVLLGAVGFVLLIACANVANLLLARAMTRSREMALRGALGAGRWRLVRQLLTESLALSLAGGTLGVALAALALTSVASLAPVSIPRLDTVAIDGRVLGFALLISTATGVLFGLLPALRGSRYSLQTALSSDSRSTVGGASGRARKMLVVADLALALVLLAGAGLMLKTVARLMDVNPGFNTRGVLALNFSLVGTAYAEDASVVAFIDRAVARVRGLPGVEAAAATGQIPLGGNGDTLGFHIEGRIKPNASEDPEAERYSVTPDYFRALGIPLIRGRLFTEADRADVLPVMLISATTARSLFPGDDPIGRRVRTGDATSGPWRTIVGIVGDVRHHDLVVPVEPQMYFPQAQAADSFLVMAVRTSLSAPETLTGSIRAVIRDLDPGVPVYDVATMEALVARSVAERRFVMRLLGGFAALALLLAAIGLYGVVSYTVAQRTRELGVRVALGAGPWDILRLVFASGALTVATGLGVGVVAALVLMQSMSALLFGVGAADPSTLATASGVLAVVAVAAHWLPFRRAVRVDPAIALRQD